MSISTLPLAALRKAIETPRDGFVGIVDDVLSLCRQYTLHLDWHDNRCHITSIRGDEEAVLEVPLRKSVFRAILARVATLCADQAPETFAPYGGRGELSVGSNPPTLMHLTWVNTLGEQSLSIIPLPRSSEGGFRQPDGVGSQIEEIAQRAYQIWLAAGCPHGQDQEMWLQAEAEVMAETTHAKRDRPEHKSLNGGAQAVKADITKAL